MGDRLYPLTFRPEYRSYVWGGRNLERLGRQLPEGIVAESWEISGYPAAPTVVDAGPFADRPLTELVRDLGADLVGRRNHVALHWRRFPLLVKLLDASDRLSVQVHPPDEYAREHESEPWGKSEMWYILDAQPDAEVVLGLRRGVSEPAFRDALLASEPERWLHRVPVRAGDAVLVPAGSLHALLGGVLAVEIQQSSDLTYRVFDWNRPGLDGRPRPLHLDKALDVIDFGVIEPGTYPPRPVELRGRDVRREIVSQCDAFTVERVQIDAGGRFAYELNGENLELWATLAGDVLMNGGGHQIELSAVHFTLLPAALGPYEVLAQRPATLLRAWPGAKGSGAGAV